MRDFFIKGDIQRHFRLYPDKGSFPIIGLMVSILAKLMFAATGDGSPADANIQYIGRWNESVDSQYVSNWGGAYLKTGFTGTTVKVKLGGSANLFVGIDSLPLKPYGNANGILNLTGTALQNTTHSLRIIAQTFDDQIKFKGIVLDAGAHTVALPVRPILEFIGNSITCGATTSNGSVSAFPWLVGEALSAEHTQISISGVTLANGYYFTYWGAPTIGMSVSYFKQMPPPRYPSTDNHQNPDWDFTRYSPMLVVVNLGTNDANPSACKNGAANPCVNIPVDSFTAVCTKFLGDIRSKFPHADIFAMRTLGGYLVPATQAAVDARIAAGDAKVHYINTDGWLVSSDYNADGVHPTDAGHKKVANKLVPILQPYLDGASTAISGSRISDPDRFAIRPLNPGELLIECRGEIPCDEPVDVILHDAGGRRFITEHFDHLKRSSVKIPALPPGMYMVTVGGQSIPLLLPLARAQ